MVTVLPIEAGTKYACEIEVPSNPKLSSPMRYFPTEEEANRFQLWMDLIREIQDTYRVGFVPLKKTTLVAIMSK